MKQIKILFANIPADGHFNPLTSLALHLKSIGHDVRWYAQDVYLDKLQNMQIPHYPFKKAKQFNQFTVDENFPERKKINNKISKLNFDLKYFFISQGPLFFEDIKQIQSSFDFDILICDSAFTGSPFIKEKLKKHVISISVFPLMETSRNLAPYGLGMLPAVNRLGKWKQALLRKISDKVLFRSSNKLMRKVLAEHGIITDKNVFDAMLFFASRVLQSGTPGFEYFRADMSKHVHFIGPLLPASKEKSAYTLPANFRHYSKKVLVTQGTVEKDPGKIIIPTLEAFRNTDVMVIVTTGGSQTTALRKSYPDENFIIEDFIPFDEIMPACDVFITNGGYGGVLMSIQHKLPMVVAGVHEGKNEICSRVGYFELGINLKTETPDPLLIRAAVKLVLQKNHYKNNVMMLREEFKKYDPLLLIEKHVNELTGIKKKEVKPVKKRKPALIY